MTEQARAIRWGVAGCGQIAVDKTISALLVADGAELVAIADPLPERRELAARLAADAGKTVRQYHDDLELLTHPDLDAIYIAMPTGLHSGAVVAAARAGKAILCEKPLGRNPAEVADMVRTCEDLGVALSTGYMSLFSDVFQLAAQFLRDGEIGEVTFVDAHFSYPCMDPYPPGQPGGWRWTDPDGGGPLLDIGVYLALGIRELLGDRVAQVCPLNCSTIAPPEAVVPDTTTATFRTAGGVPGVFTATFSHGAHHLHVYGTRGNLVLSDLFMQSAGACLEVTKDGRVEHLLDTRTDPALPHNDNYRREFQHFSQALLAGVPHRPRAEDVLEDALLLDALSREVPMLPVPTAASYLASLAGERVTAGLAGG